jgi:Na+-transporting NADH:ubiquinone oxidoreductase subunit NqrF
MLSEAFPTPNSETLVCLCGPPLMNKLVVGLLNEIGF